MAETSKRNWPWKKKSQDKAVAAPGSIDSSPRASPHNSKFFDEQDVSEVLSDHARVSDEAISEYQSSELKLRQLSDELSAAHTELTAKDILVKQHAKVAEEAVTGWEKAEAEAAAMKQQLDTIMHQKLATEDRVSHLDGALKECMRQLRHVREEQELRIHEAIVKKTREYDELRQEMEAKLAEAGYRLQDACSEALDSRAEARALSIALQDRTEALAGVNDAKARAETEVKALQGQLQSMDKENSTLKYELHVLSKEVEIRNAEREYERKAAENAGKNQLENVKKIAKLEVECQRLRILVSKKLPGPAALAQMKIQADALGGGNSNEFSQRRRRSLGRSVSSSLRDPNFHPESTLDTVPNSCRSREDALSERLVGMGDELKMLKEALAKRDGELQLSRLMCAKTATKLSNVEEQLEAALGTSKRKNSQLCPTNQNEGPRQRDESVDPWDAASALLAELAQFKKASDKGLDIGKLDFMDDFAEMEKLAMASEKGELDNKEANVSPKSYNAFTEIFEKRFIAKQRELEEANRMYKEISQQLIKAEDQLTILHVRNGTNETALVTLQEKLDSLCDKEGEDDGIKDRNITKELEDLVEAQSISIRASAAHEAMFYYPKGGSQNAGKLCNSTRRSVSWRSSSEVRYDANVDIASVSSDADSKPANRGSYLLTAVCSILEGVEALAQAMGADHELTTFQSGHQDGAGLERQPMQWKDSELDCRIQSLTGASNKLLQGKTDVIGFLAELSGVISYLVNICSRNRDMLDERRGNQAHQPNLKEKEEEVGRVFPA